jgi:hypothetical protein
MRFSEHQSALAYFFGTPQPWYFQDWDQEMHSAGLTIDQMEQAEEPFLRTAEPSLQAFSSCSLSDVGRDPLVVSSAACDCHSY